MKGIRVGLEVAAVGLAITAASATVAWLFGLLFGIPRSIARGGAAAPGATQSVPNSTQTESSVPASRVNTNLEDVSDWLTKTIIGVGLTQLFAIPHVVWTYATILDQATLNGRGGGALLILSLAAAGGAGGFWLGYVTTRTFLTRLFDLFDQKLGNVEPAVRPQNLQLDPQGKIAASTEPELAQTDQKLRSIPLETLSNPREMAAWGAAQARMANFGEAFRALRLAASKAPNDSDIQTLLTTVKAAYEKSSASKPQS